MATSQFLAEVGRTLRQMRKARGLTLRDVGIRSNGRFKPTAVAGYERGERSISLERFFELSNLYGITAERLLAEIARRLAGGRPTTIDLSRIDELPPEERRTVSRFVDQVVRLRSSPDRPSITLRSEDVEVLATASGHYVEEFLEHLRPALVETEANHGG